MKRLAKKQGILHQGISTLVASMGHTDTLVVADAGLPISEMVWRLDLALTEGVSSFLQTVQVILQELEVQECHHCRRNGCQESEIIPTTPRIVRRYSDFSGSARRIERANAESQRNCANRRIYTLCECYFGGRGGVLNTTYHFKNPCVTGRLSSDSQDYQPAEAELEHYFMFFL